MAISQGRYFNEIVKGTKRRNTFEKAKRLRLAHLYKSWEKDLHYFETLFAQRPNIIESMVSQGGKV